MCQFVMSLYSWVFEISCHLKKKKQVPVFIASYPVALTAGMYDSDEKEKYAAGARGG